MGAPPRMFEAPRPEDDWDNRLCGAGGLLARGGAAGRKSSPLLPLLLSSSSAWGGENGA